MNHVSVKIFGGRGRWGWGRNEREDIVSPFMWRLRSKFKDERSLGFQCQLGEIAGLVPPHDLVMIMRSSVMYLREFVPFG